MKRVQIIMTNLGEVEDQIFRDRQQRELAFRRKNKQRKMQEKMEKQAANEFRDNTGRGALGVMRAGETATAHGAKGMIMEQRYANMDRMRQQGLVLWEYPSEIWLKCIYEYIYYHKLHYVICYDG